MKKLGYFLLGMALLSLIVGCNSNQAGKKGNDKIVIWTQAAADHPEGKMFASRVERYNEENPDKPKVEIQNITRAGAGSGYIDKLNAAITANDMPDIFTLDGPDIAAYVDAGVIGELDGYMSDEFKEGFTESIIQQGTVDEKLYAFGYSDSAVAIMYNEEMINALPDNVKALIPSMDKDWTWDQFVELARAIDNFAKTTSDPAFSNYELAVSTLLSDVASGVYETGTYYFTPLMWGNDTNIVSDDGLTVDGVLNNEKSVEALTKFSKLFEGDPLGSASEPEKAFHTGKAALAVAGFWYVNELKDNYPDLKFKTVRYPKMNEDYNGLYTPSGSWAFVRNGNIEDEEKINQVVEVMEWLTNDEAAEEYYHAQGSIPSRVNSIDVIDANTDNPYYNEAWKVMQYQVENTNKARPVSSGYPYLSETYAKDILLKIAQNKTTDSKTIKKYLDDAVKKLDLEFEKYKH
ncbi:ABC transporter substrate-binding protein [Lederbergia citrea]|uniref:ABC transporter substrate-binding protein n=1 Tax=Lederbergia citrea TaxID=2833581 RepID=UPI001BC9CE2F|nr:extracellular solute-binding protein [Lederbergia citrea]